MKWAYGVTTVPERIGTLLPQTLASLAAAGFDRPVLFVDGQITGYYDHEVVCHPRVGQMRNWMHAIFYLFTTKDADRYAIFEDDVLACRQLREYLERCPAGKVYWNLITLDENRVFTQDVPGWHESNQLGRSACGLVFDRSTVDCLLRMERFVRGPGNAETMSDAVQNKLPLPGRYKPSSEDTDEAPQFSFSELAHYENCPMRYRLSDSLGFQPQLATELGYGKTIHHVLRRIADLTRQNGKLPTEKQIAGLFEDEFYLPFANKAAFEQLSLRARTLINRYFEDYRDDLLRVWETERPFSLHLANGTVNGRADVILDREGNVFGDLALVDYKTSADPHADDVYAFQLAVYAAAGRGEGLNVRAAYLHELNKGDRKSIPIAVANTLDARHRASDLVDSIVAHSFPARPEKKKCRGCDMRAICVHALCTKRDL